LHDYSLTNSGVTKPDYYLPGLLIYALHQQDLLFSFPDRLLNHALVDTDRINPNHSGFGSLP
jgi:hypothetical protein